MINNIKKILGYNSTDVDERLLMLINAAKEDLRLSGVKQSALDNPSDLINTAIVCYVLAMSEQTDAHLYEGVYAMQKELIRKSELYGNTKI